MMLKMIAIGILALLGLSSMMQPRAFRMFVGGAGALCLALFLGFVAVTGRSPGEADSSDSMPQFLSQVLDVLGRQPTFRELAELASNEILNRVEDDVARGRNRDLEAIAKEAEERKGVKPVITRTFNVARATNEMREMTRPDQIQALLSAKLDDFRKDPKNQRIVGLSRLRSEYLDPRLLKLAPVKRIPNNSEEELLYVLGFVEDEFADHVRLVGRHLVMKERLQLAASAAVGLGAILFIVYGLLKITNARRRGQREDYLTISNVSLV